MDLHFQETPWDLYIAVAYTLGMAAVLIGFGTGTPFAVVMILVAPGYVFTAALFPTEGALDWVERLALSLGMSVAIVPLLGLGLNFTPFGIRLASIAVTLALFTTSIGALAYWRRERLPVERRLSATLRLGLPNWEPLGRVDKALTVALAIGILLSGGTLAYVFVTPAHQQPFTEFYVLGPGGNSSGYPAQLATNQTGTVILGIANHEGSTVDYAVRVDRVGVSITYNVTDGFNETVELNRTTIAWVNVTLANGAEWTQPYSFSIPFKGLWKLQLLLFRDGALTDQELHFLVTVT